jgi:hypothetical protein
MTNLGPFNIGVGAGGLAQVVDSLPSKHEALSSNPRTGEGEGEGE